MNPVLVLGVLLAASTPVPQPTDPPTIIDVRSQSRVCTAIKERIGPGVAGLLQNDRAILDGLGSMRRMGADAGTSQLQMDELHLENAVAKITRNLDAINAVLARPEPADITSEDAQKIERVKETLRAVAHQQLATLNTLDGTLESAQSGQMSDIDTIPNFARNDHISQASTNGNFHPPVALTDKRRTRAGPTTAPAPNPDVPPVEPPPPASVADFFPDLARSEAGAGREIADAAAGCARLRDAPELPRS